MSSSLLLLDAIGYLDEELLERSEKKQAAKKYTWVGWTALAACVCLVCAGAWGIVNPVKSNDNAALETIHTANMIPTLIFKNPGEICDYSYGYSENITEKIYEFDARFIISGYTQNANASSAFAINNRNQLEELIASNNVPFLTDFEKEYLKYNDAFFEEKQLIIVALEGDSSSVSYKVANIFRTQESWVANIERNYPECITSDLVCWNVLIEVEAGSITENDRIIIQYVDEMGVE